MKAVEVIDRDTLRQLSVERPWLKFLYSPAPDIEAAAKSQGVYPRTIRRYLGHISVKLVDLKVSCIVHMLEDGIDPKLICEKYGLTYRSMRRYVKRTTERRIVWQSTIL